MQRDPGKSRVMWPVGVLIAGAVAVSAAGCGGGGNGGGPMPTPTSTVVPTPVSFTVTNLVSNMTGVAPVTDSNLLNAWGIARSASGPWWVADNHAGVSTVYNGSGQPFPTPPSSPLVVTVPPPGGSAPDTAASPTGIVFNGTTDFVVSQGSTSGAALFIFATEDGTISGWNNTVNAAEAILTVDNSADEAIYKGLTMGSTAAGNFLYASNFHAGTVDVFDHTFAPAAMSGSFTDPNIPPGFAPFGIQNIGGRIMVTYAKQDENKEDDVPGPGNGYVDVFDTAGNLLSRFASQGSLNSPWGLVQAPASFGSFGGDIIIGNFGDGHLNVFDSSGAFKGQLTVSGGSAVVIPGLWGLGFGNGMNAGSANTLYFTAGPNGEEDGLFGMIEAAGG